MKIIYIHIQLIWWYIIIIYNQHEPTSSSKDFQRWFQNHLNFSIWSMLILHLESLWVRSKFARCVGCVGVFFPDAPHSLEEQSNQRVIARRQNPNLIILCSRFGQSQFFAQPECWNCCRAFKCKATCKSAHLQTSVLELPEWIRARAYVKCLFGHGPK